MKQKVKNRRVGRHTKLRGQAACSLGFRLACLRVNDLKLSQREMVDWLSSKGVVTVLRTLQRWEKDTCTPLEDDLQKLEKLLDTRSGTSRKNNFSLGERLKRLRRGDLKLSQKDMVAWLKGKGIHTTIRTLQRWETDNTLPLGKKQSLLETILEIRDL